jgi:MFS family permease
VRAHPWRTVGVGLIGSLGSAGHAVGFQFSAFHVQTVHGWSPGQYTLMAVAAGLFGVVGNPYAGRAADRRGRRVVGFAVLAGFSFCAVAFYHAPGWLLPLVWMPMVFTVTGGNTIVRALSTELFPTSFRGTASGWLQLVEAAGRSSGLFLVYWGTPAGGSNVPMISIVVFCTLLAGLLVLALPETGRRELEEISSDEAFRPSTSAEASASAGSSVRTDPTQDPIG